MNWKKLIYAGALEQAREIITFVEEIAAEVGISPRLVLEKVARKVKNPFVSEVARRFKRGLPRSKAYRGIFDRETIVLLEVAEREGLEVSTVFREYSKIKEKVDRVFGRIRGAVRGGATYAFVVYSIGLYVARQIGKIVEEISQSVSNPAVFSSVKAYVHYYPLAFLIFVLYAVFFVFPKTSSVNPIVKKINSLFRLLNLLMIYRIGIGIGLQSTHILNVYARLYDDAARFLKKIPPSQRNITGLARYLSKYLKPEEAILLEEAVRMGQGKQFISMLSDRYFDRIEEIGQKTVSALKPINTILTGVIAGLVVGIVAKLLITMSSVMSSMNGGG